MEWASYNLYSKSYDQVNKVMYKPLDFDNKLEPLTFELIRDLVYNKSGIKLESSKESLIRSRIGKRMRILGISTHNEYLKKVIEDKSERELVHLLDAISTNVTSFFRGIDHFHFLENIMKEWVLMGQRKFRIWSSACSSGEEPYSIAMTILGKIDTSINVKILATDISTKVLEKAQEGMYESEKIEQIPIEFRDKYLEKADLSGNSFYKIKPILKEIIVFRRLNLSESPFPMNGPMDLIFCRNVMIYFDNSIRQKLLKEIYRLLKPNGYLFVGHAESLIGSAFGFKAIKPSIYIKD